MDDPISREEHERVLRVNTALREQIECLRKDTKTLVTLLLSTCEPGKERESGPQPPEQSSPGTATWPEPGTGLGMIMKDFGQELADGTFGHDRPFGEPHREYPN